jgi:hypothetical protein
MTAVDPPELSGQLFDLKTGMATRNFLVFLHRLWKRSGGNDDNAETMLPLLSMALTKSAIGVSEQRVLELINRMNPLAGYHLNDEDSDGDVKYYGYLKEGSDDHYFERIDYSVSPFTYRYSSDGNNYATAWTGRVDLEYGRLNEVDIA